MTHEEPLHVWIKRIGKSRLWFVYVEPMERPVFARLGIRFSRPAAINLALRWSENIGTWKEWA